MYNEYIFMLLALIQNKKKKKSEQNHKRDNMSED